MAKRAPYLFPGGRPGLVWLAILILAVALSAGCSRKKAETPPPAPEPAVDTTAPKDPPPEPEKPGPVSPFDGLKAEAAQIGRRPLAVMIDNQADARPQAGLNQAEMVYEILAEGGITRYMAVFLRNGPPAVGPVRSARHYFVQLAAELDALYAHAGQSPQAEEELARLKIPDIDDLKGAGGFFRSRERQAPHNLYLNASDARAFAARRGIEKAGQVPQGIFSFKADLTPAGKAAVKISIPYPYGYQGYTVNYEYDSPNDRYARSVAGKPQVDAADGRQVAPKNVIVQFTPHRAIPGDREGRIDVTLVGSGKGLVFTKGTVREIKWDKKSVRDRTRFTDASGNAIELQPGQTWIQVVPVGTTVEY